MVIEAGELLCHSSRKMEKMFQIGESKPLCPKLLVQQGRWGQTATTRLIRLKFHLTEHLGFTMIYDQHFSCNKYSFLTTPWGEFYYLYFMNVESDARREQIKLPKITQLEFNGYSGLRWDKLVQLTILIKLYYKHIMSSSHLF